MKTRADRWYDTYNAALTGIYAGTKHPLTMAPEAAMKKAVSAANLMHGGIYECRREDREEAAKLPPETY